MPLSQRFRRLQQSRSIYDQYPSLPPCQRSWNATWRGGGVMDTARDIIDDHQFGSLRGSSTIHALVELVTGTPVAKSPRRSWSSCACATTWFLQSIWSSRSFPSTGEVWQLGPPRLPCALAHLILVSAKTKGQLRSAQSEWATINAGVPQGTVLGPVGFLLHINDLYILPATALSTWTIPRSGSLAPRTAATANCRWQPIRHEWSEKNLMKINPDKTKTMGITFTRTHYDIPPPPCVHV